MDHPSLQTQLHLPLGGSAIDNKHLTHSLGQEDPLEEEMATHSSLLSLYTLYFNYLLTGLHRGSVVAHRSSYRRSVQVL